MSNSMGYVKIRSFATLVYRYRVQSRTNSSQDHRQNSMFSSNYGSMFSSLIVSSTANCIKPTVNHIVTSDDKKIARRTFPGPVKPGFPSWVKWILGYILSIVLPFWKQKWIDLLILGGTLEKVVDEVEIVAEMVEKVAITTEKISSEVADKLPDNTILKEAALVVEHISLEAAKDAKLTQEIIHKVDELEHDLTDLGTVVKPIFNIIIKEENGKK